MKEVIQKQVEEGELELVEQSDLVSPIVVVKNKDGGLRVCAVFLVTIKPSLKTKTFPLPTPDEVFAMFESVLDQQFTP